MTTRAEKQHELDVMKWNDSVERGHDSCGSYDFCADCNKSVDYPCAFAFEKHNAAKKPAAKKAETAKKPAAKKTAAKKPAAKK